MERRQEIVGPVGRAASPAVRRHAAQLANGLSRRGLGPRDVVAICSENRIEVIEIYLAAFMLGAYFLPIPTSTPHSEFRRLVGAARAKVVIVDAAAERRFRQASPEWQGHPAMISLDGPIGYLQLLMNAPLTDVSFAGGFLFPTSGTTGPPRLIQRPLPKLDPQAAARRFARLGTLFGLCDPGVHLVAGSLMQPAPLLFACALFHAGHTLLLMDQWNVRRFIELVARERATNTFLVPAMLQSLAAEAGPNVSQLSSLNTIIHGTAPCPTELKQELLELLGDVLFEYYATVELAGTVIGPAEWRERPGSVGRPLEGILVEVHGDDGPLPASSIGRVVLTTDGRLGPAIRHETGDLGWLDEAGYLFLRGRIAETTLVAGRIVYFGDVEAALTAHPKVEDARVFAVPHPRLGSRLEAEITLSARSSDRIADLRDLRTHLRRRLSPPQRPGRLHVVGSVSRTSAGKLSRAVISPR